MIYETIPWVIGWIRISISKCIHILSSWNNLCPLHGIGIALPPNFLVSEKNPPAINQCYCYGYWLTPPVLQNASLCHTHTENNTTVICNCYGTYLVGDIVPTVTVNAFFRKTSIDSPSRQISYRKRHSSFWRGNIVLFLWLPSCAFCVCVLAWAISPVVRPLVCTPWCLLRMGNVRRSLVWKVRIGGWWQSFPDTAEVTCISFLSLQLFLYCCLCCWACIVLQSWFAGINPGKVPIKTEGLQYQPCGQYF